MKQKMWLAVGFCTVAFLCAAVSAAAVCAAQEGIPAESVLYVEADAAADETKYVLTVYGGQIGVFCDGKLIYTASVDVSGMRAADRKLLENGIETSSYEDVLHLLEDFGS